jgi:putative phosphoribosyl transferase
MSLFTDRRSAGRVLAWELDEFVGHDDVVVLGLPRGGVPVAYEVARSLGAPLDVFVVRKLGVPGREELAMGALASGGIVVLSHDIVRGFGITKEEILEAARTENHELRRRDQAYRAGIPPLSVSGKTVILVDDGLATGATMRVAIRALRQNDPARVVAAVPVGAPESCTDMSDEADVMVCARAPNPFEAVGTWYEEFSQTSDEEVRDLLLASRRDQERLHPAAAS